MCWYAGAVGVEGGGWGGEVEALRGGDDGKEGGGQGSCQPDLVENLARVCVRFWNSINQSQLLNLILT